MWALILLLLNTASNPSKPPYNALSIPEDVPLHYQNGHSLARGKGAACGQGWFESLKGFVSPVSADPPMFEAKIQNVLSVPTQFLIAPSGSLSVAAFLDLDLPTALETDASATTRFIFSKKSAMLQLPMGFISRSVPPLQMTSSLCDHVSGALQDGIQSVIHPSFPNDPLPLWVLLYWVSMSYALENQCDWRTSHDWVLARLDAIPADGPELEVIDKVLDILESLPWDTPLKGFGALTDLRTTELRPLLAPCPIHGRILDSMIAVVVQHIQVSDDDDLHNKWWKNYKTDRTFRCLCTIGSALCEGTLQCVLFPININNVYWAVIEVNTIHQSISYANSLGWSWPTEDIDAIRHWLGYHGFARFNKATTLQHGEQLDSFLCGIAAINMIKHALFRDLLFTNDQAFSLHMGEFLNLAYDHLELSDLNNDPNPNDNSNDSSYSDSTDIEIQETQPSPPTPLTCPPQNKPKLDLRATDADLNMGLFKFFPKVSCDEHLALAWKPSAQKLKDQEQGRHQQKFDVFEKTVCKRERAAEHKRQQQKPSLESVLHDSNPQPPAVNIAKASCPYRQLQRHARSMQKHNLGRKRKREDTDACKKAGTVFNLSFESMTSHEALHALHDVKKNDAVAWDHIKTAQYRVETPEADEEAEPPFTQAADVKLDASDVAVDAVLQHITLGELSVPEGYSADGLGNLMAHNEAESYERVLDDTEPQFTAVTTDSSKEVDVEGRGKHRCVANT
ncbi:hypothetical protein F4604DRAFT_1681622 [Suillus subluteus]|nr:hypothetical protein F4604DRAFT_1681622 [Suillus subluteus]